MNSRYYHHRYYIYLFIILEMNNNILSEEIKEYEIKIKEKKTTPMFLKSLVGEYFMQPKGYSNLKIKPSFQRLYRWDKERKLKFIESIFLKMPIPPIFLFEDTLNYSALELVDGLQRISTILEFLGVLKSENTPWSLSTLKQEYKDFSDEEKDVLNEIMQLEKEKDWLKNKKIEYLSTFSFEKMEQVWKEISQKNCEIWVILKKIKEGNKIHYKKLYSKVEKLWLIEFERSIEELYIAIVTIPNIKNKLCNVKLNFLTYLSGKTFDSLDEDALKRKFLNYEIIVNTLASDDIKLKYEVFNRINTWWVNLSNQEVRNSIILNYNEDLFEKLIWLKEHPSFNKILQLSDELKQEEKDMEYVLRFFALHTLGQKQEKNEIKVSSVKELLDNEMFNLINLDKENITKKIHLFNNIFELIKDDENILKRDSKWRVLIPAFDTILAWLSCNFKDDRFCSSKLKPEIHKEILQRVKHLFHNDVFNYHTWTPWYVEHKLEYWVKIWIKWFNLDKNIQEITEEIEKMYWFWKK